MAGMLFVPKDSQIPELLKRARDAAHRDDRIKQAQRKARIYRNDFRGLVEEVVRREVKAENFDDLSPFIHTATNLLEGIAQEAALNYDSPARRYLVVPGFEADAGAAPARSVRAEGSRGEGARGESTDPERGGGAPANADEEPEAIEEPEVPGTKGLALILSYEDRDALGAEVERLALVHECVAVRSVVRKGRLEHDIFTPDQFDVVPDPEDHTKAAAVFWEVWEELAPLEPGSYGWVTHYWDAQRWARFDPNGVRLEGEDHKIGRLPFAFARRGLASSSFWYRGSGDDLYWSTIEVCVLKTHLSRGIRLAAWQQPVVAGELQGAREQLTGPYRPIQLAQGDSVTSLDLGPRGGPVAIAQSIREWEDGILGRYGIPPDEYRARASGAAAPASGYARKQARARLLRRARERSKYLVQWEIDLLDADRAVMQAVGLLEGENAIPPEAEFRVDLAEPEFEQAPVEQREQDKHELALGLVSVVELYKRLHPDVTDEEAEARILENRLRNRPFSSAFGGGSSSSGGAPPLTFGGGGGAAA